MFDFLNVPLAWILELLSRLVNGSFAGAVFLFTLLINLVMLPLSIKSQRASVDQIRLKPKLDSIKEQCGDDQNKYRMETQRIYQEENVKMGGGCLPLIIRMVLMLSIYSVILSPITYMTGVEKSQIENITTGINAGVAELKEQDKEGYKDFIDELGWSEKSNARNNELAIVDIVRNEEKMALLEETLPEKQYKKIEADIKEVEKKDKETNVNYTLISEKINLTETPKFSINIFKAFKPIWLMPIIAFMAQMLTSVLSMLMQKKNNPEAPTMSGMLLTMPLISLFIGFALPGGVTFYWACSSLIGGFIQLAIQNFYGPHKMLARIRSKELANCCEEELKMMKKLSSAGEE